MHDRRMLIGSRAKSKLRESAVSFNKTAPSLETNILSSTQH
jgi:hypothetical protein